MKKCDRGSLRFQFEKKEEIFGVKYKDNNVVAIQDSWTTDYLFIKWNQKPLCLVCSATLSISKAFNVKKHYNALHQEKYDKTVGKPRKDLVKKIKILCPSNRGYLKNQSRKIKMLQPHLML